MKLRVRSRSGTLQLRDDKLTCASTVQSLLDSVAAASAEDSVRASTADAGKLRVVFNGRALKLDGRLGAVGLQDGDTVVVLEKRAPPPQVTADSTPPPSMETVNRVTLAEAKARGNVGASVYGQNGGRPLAVAPRRMSNEGIPTSLRDMESHLQSLLNAVEGLNSSMYAGPAVRLPHTSERASSSDAANREGGRNGEEEEEEEDDDHEAEEEEPVPLVEPNASHLAQLMEMGFVEEAVKKALILNNNHLELAMDWLLEHAGDADAATPLTEQQLRQISRRRPRRHRVNLSNVRPSRAAAAVDQDAVPPDSPPAQLLETLTEMGFERPQASAALQAFGNNVEMACHWLLTAGSRPGAVPPTSLSRRPPSGEESAPADGDDADIVPPSTGDELSEEVSVTPAARSGSSEVETPYGNPSNESRHALLSSFAGDDADMGQEHLDAQLNDMQSFLASMGVDAVALGELLQNPVIQHALQHERVMQAFQEMMQDPSTAHRYLTDPEVGPALLQVHSHLGNDDGMSSFSPSLDDE